MIAKVNYNLSDEAINNDTRGEQKIGRKQSWTVALAPDSLIYEEYRRLARHSPRAEANIAKACNTMQWSHKIS